MLKFIGTSAASYKQNYNYNTPVSKQQKKSLPTNTGLNKRQKLIMRFYNYLKT